MATGRGLGGRGVGHVLHVSLPRVAVPLELGRDVLYARRIEAALPDVLPVGGRRSGKELREELAVGLGLGVGSLPADHRDVVVEAEVTGRVVVGDESAL